MLTIFIRTIIVYFVLVISIRFMGKRQIGEIQISEFIITLMLSEIAVSPISNRNMPILHAVVAILLLLAVEVIISYLLIKSNLLKRIFYGSPSVLIKRGRLMQKEIKKNRVEIDELISELRQKGYPDISEVYYAILEDNGKLSVFPKSGKNPVTPDDLSLSVTEKGIAHICIIDGNIIEHSLKVFGWDVSRVLHELEKNKARLPDVFLMTVDDSGVVNIIQKEKKRK
ncbi:MAG: DUF421 domain-containing protein [Eubacteriales bacterium]